MSEPLPLPLPLPLPPSEFDPPLQFVFRLGRHSTTAYTFHTRLELYAALGIPPAIGDAYETDRLRESVVKAMRFSPYRPVVYKNQIFPSLYAAAQHLRTDPSKLYWLCSESLLDYFE